MPRQGRRWTIMRVICLLTCLFICLPGVASQLHAQTIDWRMPVSWEQDAQPVDLFAIDAETAWVVGDRGMVLRTSNGGKDWVPVELKSDPLNPQSPAITCRLESVYFVSPDHGWIAGGYANPLSSTSHGVLFSTSDGGKTWKPVPGIALPRIKQVRFETRFKGIAIGEGNDLKPSGIFHTHDGGRSWTTANGGSVQAWQTGDVGNGVIVASDATGKLIRQADEKLELSPSSFVPGDQGRQVENAVIRQMKMLDERFGFAVGDNGRYIGTRNGGLSWDPVEGPFGLVDDRSVFVPYDFRCLEKAGARTWIAGDPGSRLFIGDEHAAWRMVSLPVNAPITRIRFSDDQNGWAISQCGDIIRSQDGGETWSIQRRGTRGVALMQIAGNPGNFIPELFGKYCADENYIGGALVLTLPGGPAVEDNACSIDVLRQALGRVGGSYVEDRTFHALPDGSGIPAGAREFLVRRIRTMQPRVIAIPPERVTNINSSVRALVLDAVKAAADRRQYAAHLDHFGLEPWEVGKVVVMDRGSVSNLKITPGYYMMGMGALLGDHSMVSRMLLNQNPVETRPVSLTTIFTSPYAAGSGNSLFGTIENTDARIPVRKGRRQTNGNMAAMRQLASKTKTMTRLLDSSDDMSAGIWNNTLSEWALQLGDATAGVWLYELASKCDQKGDVELAVQTHLYLSRQLAKHPLAGVSLRWLYRYYSSAEQAHLATRQMKIAQASAIAVSDQDDALRTRPVTQNFNGTEITAWQIEDPRVTDQNSVQQATWSDSERDALYRRRYQQARAISQSLRLADPAALDSERLALSRIGLNRKIDPQISISEQLKQLASNPEFTVSDLALRELGIVNRDRGEGVVRNEVTCATATERPWLDGVLTDSIWSAALQNQAVIPLASLSGQITDDQIMLAADAEFLFIAVRCRKQSEVTYTEYLDPRDRDDPLLNFDRVEIAIDIDRDFETAFLFSVSSSGQVAESIGDNLNWNPEWFVATSQSGEFWQAEIAIPLEAISRQGDYWAVAAQRHLRNQPVSASTAFPHADKPQATNIPVTTDSLHRSALENRSVMQALPVHSFRVVRMPWLSDESDSDE